VQQRLAPPAGAGAPGEKPPPHTLTTAGRLRRRAPVGERLRLGALLALLLRHQQIKELAPKHAKHRGSGNHIASTSAICTLKRKAGGPKTVAFPPLRHILR
jgi:hypothetical protein